MSSSHVQFIVSGLRIIRRASTDMCILGGMSSDLCSMSQQGGQEPEVTGSPTEKAILSWGLKVQKVPL